MKRQCVRRRLIWFKNKHGGWGVSADVDARTVDTHVSRVRRKLSLDGGRGWKLVSIYGFGYRFERVDGSS